MAAISDIATKVSLCKLRIAEKNNMSRNSSGTEYSCDIVAVSNIVTISLQHKTVAAVPQRQDMSLKRVFMPVIAVSNPKGGAGKSTATLLLAFYLAQSRASVCVLDADPNQPIMDGRRTGYRRLL